jgi:hypothetical protein
MLFKFTHIYFISFCWGIYIKNFPNLVKKYRKFLPLIFLLIFLEWFTVYEEDRFKLGIERPDLYAPKDVLLRVIELVRMYGIFLLYAFFSSSTEIDKINISTPLDHVALIYYTTHSIWMYNKLQIYQFLLVLNGITLVYICLYWVLQYSLAKVKNQTCEELQNP